MATGTRAQTKIILYENFYKESGGKNIALATLKKGTPFKEVARELGAVKTIFLLSEMIRNYCSQFNVSKNMSDGQREDLAADLYLDFKDRQGNAVMLEELMVFFDRAAKGEFFDRTGKKLIPFDRIDRALIEEIMDRYFETDRTEAIWQIEDEKRAVKPQEDEPAERLEGGTSEPLKIDDLYTKYAGSGKIGLLKKMKEFEERYGKE